MSGMWEDEGGCGMWEGQVCERVRSVNGMW